MDDAEWSEGCQIAGGCTHHGELCLAKAYLDFAYFFLKTASSVYSLGDLVLKKNGIYFFKVKSESKIYLL